MRKLTTNAKQATDPTRTITMRKQWEADFKRRFKRVMKSVSEVVGKNDVFGLNSPTMNKFSLDNLTASEQVPVFMDWLAAQTRKEVLGVEFGTPQLTAASDSWMNVYIRKGYNNGVNQGAANLRGAGASVSSKFVEGWATRPIHADRLGLIFIRTYQNLEGINDAMAAQLRAIMAEGMLKGSSRELAKMINDRISKIGITRARVLARTEINRAHNAAKINTFKEAGLESVDVEAEVMTAGDDRVSDICQNLASGGPYTLQEAENLLPAHPNCRSTLKPVIRNGTGIELR